MELESFLIFVISLVSNTIGVQIMIGHIQVLQKHPKLQECAQLMLLKTSYFSTVGYGTTPIGGRVTSDGKCEGFYLDRKFNETIASENGNGYAYFKYTSINDTFKPPIIVDGYEKCILPYRNGAKIMVTFRTREKLSKILSIGFPAKTVTDNRAWLPYEGPLMAVDVDTTKMCEVSFLFETDYVTLHMNGIKIGKIPRRYNSPEVDYTFLELITNGQELVVYSVNVALYPQ